MMAHALRRLDRRLPRATRVAARADDARVAGPPSPARPRQGLRRHTRSCAASTSTSRPASSWPSSARAAAARARCCASSSAWTQPSAGRLWLGDGPDALRRAAAAGSCSRSRGCCPGRGWSTTSRSGSGREGSRAERLERARAALDQVGLRDKAGELARDASGGQRQRVALARALVSRPQLLALDEPLGALDALTRIDMQALLERVWLGQGFTAVLVTHDVSEAVALADRILVIEDGGISPRSAGRRAAPAPSRRRRCSPPRGAHPRPPLPRRSAPPRGASPDVPSSHHGGLA